MKKVITTLGIAIAVFVVTLYITNSYISSKSIEAADSMVMQKMDEFCSDFDGDLLMTKNAVYGFLAGNLIADTTRSTDCFFVDDDKMRFFRDGLQEHLAAFLNANPYYESATFIIEKDTAAHASKESYYAPLLRQGSDSLIDLARNYDISQSRSIKKCKATLKPLWALPSKKSNRTMVCFYVPLCRKHDGSFFGAFSITLNISTIESKIENHLPYGSEDSEMIIATEDDEIVSAFPPIYKDYTSYLDLRNSVSENVSDVVNDTVNKRKVINYGGTKYFQYVRRLKCAPWRIITACKTDAVYAESNRLMNVVLITSFIGMLLMLVSCIVVMLQIYYTHRKKEAAERELNMASRVQMSLLRERDYGAQNCNIHAYIQPAREAGGDLYDYVMVDGKLVFCIGDVSGKGMPAALFMTQVMSLFRSAVKHSTEPSAILSYINEVMADDNPDMTFCTLFVGTLDGTTLTFANAGHDSPLLLPSLNAPHFIPMDSDFPIGVEPDCEYSSDTYTLQKGDAIVLYTDGITEAKNKLHELYGEQRIIETLSARTENSPQHCTDLLLSSVRSFVNGAEQSDDITILTIYNK